MKNVKLGVLMVATALCAVLTWLAIDVNRQLEGLGELSENLMGRMYHTSDEN